MSNSSTQKPARASNIELLRIIAIFGVIILHLNNKLNHGGFEIAQEGSMLYYFLLVLESYFIFPVDLFFIISGYFMAQKNSVSIRKPVELIVQVMLINLSYTLFSTLIVSTPPEKFNIKILIGALIPANYFVILYCAVFLVSPYINKVFENMSKKKMTEFVLLIFIIFSLEPILVDLISKIFTLELTGLSTIGMDGSMRGYSFTNFMLCYIIGCFLKKSEFEISFKLNMIIWLITAVSISVWACISSNVQWEYCNPLVIIEAASLFLLFKKIDMGSNKFINILSKGVFTVFLVHGYILKYAIKFVFISDNVFIVFAKMILSCVVIFIICWIIHIIYDFIMKFIFDFIENKFGFYKISVSEKEGS